MKYVLDSGVALKWVLPEADSGKATRLRDEYGKGLHELIAPDIFSSEIANGLVSAERQKRIRPGESAIFLNDILSTAPSLHHSAPLLIRATEIAIATKQAVYDCIYVALAETAHLGTLVKPVLEVGEAHAEHFLQTLWRRTAG